MDTKVAVLISKKRHGLFIGPDAKKSHRNGYLSEEYPKHPGIYSLRGDDLRTRAQEVSRALGLTRNFLEDVKSVPVDILRHRGLKGLIVKRIESAYYDIEKESLKGELSEDLLKQVGFHNPKVIDILVKRSRLVAQHLEPVDFIKRFVKDEFKYPAFSKNAQEHINNITALNLAEFKNDEQTEHREVNRFFHGTDHNSAVDIMKNGIELNYGRHKHDFSNGGGFYLTTSFEHAKAWAGSQTKKPVVLELKMPIKEACIWDLDVRTEEGRSAWHWVVRENRSGRPSEKLEQELEKYDFITGPISVPRYPGSDERVPDCNSYQLCVVNERFAEKILIHSVYNVHEKHH